MPVGALALAVLMGCAGASSNPAANPAPEATPEASHEGATQVELTAPEGAPGVEVVAVEDPTPPGGDGAPRSTLAFRYPSGRRVPIAQRATAWTTFRDGVALVDRAHRLLLITPDGAERVLARSSGAPPARGPRGELVYVAGQDLGAEVHVLSVAGDDRIVASGLSSAGVLAPQADGRVLFVGAQNGGVAGLWLATPGAPARCLTNCALRTGTKWGDDHVPLPTRAAAIELRGDRVAWEAADGTRRSLALSAPGATLPRVPATAATEALAPKGDGEEP